MKFFFNVVMYNCLCEDSETCVNLKKYCKDNIYILDNSEDDVIKLENQIFVQRNNWNYIDMKGNKGISKAYNTFLDMTEFDEQDIIVWLDDDTFVTKEYIEELKFNAENKYKEKIFLPIIKNTNEQIISPTIYKWYKLKRIDKECEISKVNSRNICGINTCLAVRGCIYKKYRYDERIFLDYVDSNFFFDMRMQNVNFSILPVIIIQNFFSASNPKYESKLKRFKIEVLDYKAYLKDKKVLERIIGKIRICYWTFRETIKYKKIGFLKTLIKN